MEGHETPPAGDENARRNPALAAGRDRRSKGRHRAIALLPEVRYFDPSRVEIRTENDGAVFRLSGSPIMYGAEYRVVDPWGEFVERIHFGSATDILGRGIDCRLLLNHDGLPMARTTSGTMDVWDTDEALRFKAALDARQQLSNDFYIAIERRDIDAMSVGMVVGRDDWGTEGGTETRDIYALHDLLDVSGVTYPCSPTTSIEVAHRMALQRPVESRARLRRFYLDGRSGKALDPDRFEALRSMLDPGDDLETPDGTGRLGRPDGDGETWSDPGSASLGDGTEGQDSTAGTGLSNAQDGTGSRSAPATATERREQSMSYGDRQSAVTQALRAQHGPQTDDDGFYDMWIQAIGDDWVVWQDYKENALLRCSYVIDGDGNVTLGDSQPVAQHTTYKPVEPASRATRVRVRRALRGT